MIFDLPLSHKRRWKEAYQEKEREEFHYDTYLLSGDGHQRLKVRRFPLSIYHGNLDLVETGVSEEPGNIELGKPKPVVCVEFASILKLVLEQVENHNAAIGFHDAMSLPDGLSGFFGVVEGLAPVGSFRQGARWVRPMVTFWAKWKHLELAEGKKLLKTNTKTTIKRSTKNY